MKQFEYRIENFECWNYETLVNKLNSFGEEGWELVSWTLYHQPGAHLEYVITNAIFKRKVKEIKDNTGPW